MSNTYYAGAPGEAFLYDPSKITVAASTSGSIAIELRVTDGAASADQVVMFLERLANYFATHNTQVIVPGTLTA